MALKSNWDWALWEIKKLKIIHKYRRIEISHPGPSKMHVYKRPELDLKAESKSYLKDFSGTDCHLQRLTEVSVFFKSNMVYSNILQNGFCAIDTQNKAFFF